MVERKRWFGAKYRKRRVQNVKLKAKQGGSLFKYLCTPHRDNDGPDMLNNEAEADREVEESEEMAVSEEFKPHNEMHDTQQETKSEGHKIHGLTGLYVNYSDSATWIKLGDYMRQTLIVHEPEQVQQ